VAFKEVPDLPSDRLNLTSDLHLVPCSRSRDSKDGFPFVPYLYLIQKSRAIILESLNGRWFNFNGGARLRGSPFVLVTGSNDESGQPLGPNEGEEGKGVIGKGDICNFISNFGGVVGVGRDTECWSVEMEKCDMMAAF
jgi:hypothetical protein